MRRSAWWGGLATLVVAAGLIFGAGTAFAPCYFVGGSCAAGAMAASTPSPWTGNYVASTSWMEIWVGSSAYLTVQIRPYPGASGWSWTSSQPVFEHQRFYPGQDVQHRCFHGGPGSRTVRCGFNY